MIPKSLVRFAIKHRLPLRMETDSRGGRMFYLVDRTGRTMSRITTTVPGTMAMMRSWVRATSGKRR